MSQNEMSSEIENEFDIEIEMENVIDLGDENENEDEVQYETEYEFFRTRTSSGDIFTFSIPVLTETNKMIRKRRRKELEAQREIDLASSSSSSNSDGSPPRKFRRSSRRRENSASDASENQSEVERMNRINTIENRRLFRRLLEDFLHCVVPRLSETEFKQTFRVTRKSLAQLKECFEIGAAAENLVPLEHRAHVPLSEYMIMFLWYVGTGNSYEALASTFDVGLDEAIYVIDVVTTFFGLYSKKLLPFPKSRREANFYGSSFRQLFHFPDAIGCLTTHHMRIRDHPSSDDRYLTTIQTITDARGRFLNVYINSDVKLHPRDMLEESPIVEILPELCHEKYHLIADGNHYLRRWLLTPFENPVSKNEILYNEKHNAAMNSAYKAWNSLLYRFRQLRNSLLTPENMMDIVIACCMVQNICLDERDYFELADNREGSMTRRPNEIAEAVNVIRDDPDLRSWGQLKQRQISHDML